MGLEYKIFLKSWRSFLEKIKMVLSRDECSVWHSDRHSQLGKLVYTKLEGKFQNSIKYLQWMIALT